MAFLRGNYDEVTIQRLLDRLVDLELKRQVVICSECAPHVDGDHLGASSDVRLCEYVVEPVGLQKDDQALPVLDERWHAHVDTPDDASPRIRNAAPITPILGLSIQDFAAPVAQLTDQAEMVNWLVHSLVDW